jgi:hypothetical protein
MKVIPVLLSTKIEYEYVSLISIIVVYEASCTQGGELPAVPLHAGADGSRAEYLAERYPAA